MSETTSPINTTGVNMLVCAILCRPEVSIEDITPPGDGWILAQRDEHQAMFYRILKPNEKVIKVPMT